MSKLTVFLPCRKGSQRIPLKNTKRFAGNEGGLLEIKLKELEKVKAVDTIILSTNDSLVIEIAESLSISNLIIDRRPDHLCSSSTSTDELISYLPTLIDAGNVCWTHVTSPFVDESLYSKAINRFYEEKKNGYDSLMAVTEHQSFFWDDKGPINYHKYLEKWPRTQTLKKLYEINSAFFISSIDSYKMQNDRIGNKPYKYVLSHKESIDIDWPEDFAFAEYVWRQT